MKACVVFSFFRSLLQTQQSDAVTRHLKERASPELSLSSASTSTEKQTNSIIFGKSNVCWWPKSDSDDSSAISPKPHLHFEPVEPAIKSRGDEQAWEDERIGGWLMTEQTDGDCREPRMSWWDKERDNRLRGFPDLKPLLWWKRPPSCGLAFRKGGKFKQQASTFPVTRPGPGWWAPARWRWDGQSAGPRNRQEVTFQPQRRWLRGLRSPFQRSCDGKCCRSSRCDLVLAELCCFSFVTDPARHPDLRWFTGTGTSPQCAGPQQYLLQTEWLTEKRQNVCLFEGREGRIGFVFFGAVVLALVPPPTLDSLLFIWTLAHTFDLCKWVAYPSQLL